MSGEEEEALPTEHAKLIDTGNGPTVSYEESLLGEFYGKPDEDGVYGKGADDDDG